VLATVVTHERVARIAADPVSIWIGEDHNGESLADLRAQDAHTAVNVATAEFARAEDVRHFSLLSPPGVRCGSREVGARF